MKKKIFLLGIVLSVGLASCTEKVIVQNTNSSNSELTFNATSDQWRNDAASRTLVREGDQTVWVANDRIGIFAGGTNTVSYPFITKDGGIVANFKGTVNEEEPIYCALYPYNRNATLSNYEFTTVLYAHQYAEPNSYASGMNLAVSRSFESHAQDLNFSNAAAYLRVNIPDDYAGDDIYSMRLTGNNDELLAGNVTIDVYDVKETPAVVINDESASKTIYLDQINAGSKCLNGKNYYFVLPPTDMTNGYTVTLVNEKGETATITGVPTNFERNHVYTIIVDNDLVFDGDECGTMTADGLFTVTSLDCLYEWAERVANGESTLGCYLTADIDFNDDTRNWPQIGTKDTPFTGVIKGNGKTISNFKCVTSEPHAGFVSVLGEGGSVENLTFENPVVTSDYEGNVGSTMDDGYVGVVVGQLNNEDIHNYTEGVITNCHVINPTVSGGENVGGIVGRSYGRNDAIKGCTVSGGTIKGQMFVGGIVGNSEGIVEDCHVKNNTAISHEDTQSEARVGGIVGTNNSGELVACTAQAQVSGEANDGGYDARYAGGVTGANNGTMVGCAFSGTVTGDYSGALAGESYGDMYGCYAQQATAKALIYKVKRNLNNASDVVFPTFKACYWVGDEGDAVFGSDDVADYANIESCESVSGVESVMTTMNKALDEVNGNTEYAYGSGYQYQTNKGEDATVFPVKATKPQ